MEAVPARQQILYNQVILEAVVVYCVVAEIGQTDNQELHR